MTVHAFRPREDARLDGIVRLGMAQLSPFGISEQWLLREAGDRHWQLIADRLGQPGTDFRDPEGRPVYAAFCATALRLAAPLGPLLGHEAALRSILCTLGPNRLGSLHRMTGPQGTLAELAMISCFLRHDGSGSNRQLLRAPLPGLAALPPPPPELEALARHSREMARTARSATQDDACTFRYTPLPTLDFNAVGLLYFPTFSKIVEMAAACPRPVTSREVVYLSNLDPSETVTVHPAGTATRLRGDGGRLLGVARSSMGSGDRTPG